jgi:hypothetical protein
MQKTPGASDFRPRFRSAIAGKEKLRITKVEMQNGTTEIERTLIVCAALATQEEASR